jgi:hypothetical protein
MEQPWKRLTEEFGGAEIVTGSKDVASVKADTHTALILDQVDDFGEI